MDDEFVPKPIKKIGDMLRLLPKRKNKATSERAELVGWFVDNINAERRGTKWKPVTAKYIGFKLSYLSKQDLYYMQSVLKDSMNRGYPFGKAFFGSLKVRPPKE